MACAAMGLRTGCGVAGYAGAAVGLVGLSRLAGAGLADAANGQAIAAQAVALLVAADVGRRLLRGRSHRMARTCLSGADLAQAAGGG